MAIVAILVYTPMPPGINKVSELADDPRPASSFSDTFFALANQSMDPSLQKIAETYIVHYDMEESIKNASESVGVMCEATTFLQYTIRSSELSGISGYLTSSGLALQTNMEYPT